MIINCSVLVQLYSDLEETDILEDLGIKAPKPDCEWNFRSIDITDATALKINNWADKESEPEICAEAENCAVFMFIGHEMITNIPFDQMAIWWAKKRSDLYMEYSTEEKQLNISF